MHGAVPILELSNKFQQGMCMLEFKVGRRTQDKTSLVWYKYRSGGGNVEGLVPGEFTERPTRVVAARTCVAPLKTA
jgi:hypothetical protein